MRSWVFLPMMAVMLGGCAGAARQPVPPTGDDATLAFGDGAVPGPDRGADASQPLPTVAESVAFALRLPAAAGEHALDLDGNGSADNKLGTLLATVQQLFPELALQAAIDDELQRGSLLLLFDVRARELNDSPAQLSVYLGADSDGNPADNFSGSETLSIAANSPRDLLLDGTVAGGTLHVTGTVILPLPLDGQTVLVPLRRSQVRSQLAASGMTNGILAGGIPESDITGTLIPYLAAKLDEEYKKPDTSPTTVDQLKAMFDANTDGTITAAEVAQNALVQSMFGPDVDTDNDGKPDAMSIGVGFSTVSCTIEGN